MPQVQSRFNMLLDAFRVSGKELAGILHIDSSLVSKWKNNKRSLKHNSTYLNSIIDYFISIDSISGYSTIRNLLERDYNKIDYNSPVELSVALRHWISSSSQMTSGDAAIYDFMHKNRKGREHSYLVFHGNEGRREAVQSMMEIANALPPGQEMWSYSQDSPIWFTMSESFSKAWSRINLEYLRKGNQIHVIHPVDRQYKALAISLFKWLPLHITGKTNPFYLPHYWESDIKLTLYLLKDHLLLLGVSVESISSDITTYAFTDPHILKESFHVLQSFFQNATPLFDKYNLSDSRQFSDDLTRMAGANEEQYIFTNFPFVNILEPKEIAEILEANDVPTEIIEASLNACHILSQDSIENGGHFFRYLLLSSQLEYLLRQKQIPLDTLSFFSGKVLHIPNEAFRALLKKMLEKLATGVHFEIALVDDSLVSYMIGLNMFVKRNTSACIFSLQEDIQEPLILMTRESVVVTSLFLCCDQIWRSILPQKRTHEYVIEKIHTMMEVVSPDDEYSNYT